MNFSHTIYPEGAKSYPIIRSMTFNEERVRAFATFHMQTYGYPNQRWVKLLWQNRDWTFNFFYLRHAPIYYVCNMYMETS